MGQEREAQPGYRRVAEQLRADLRRKRWGEDDPLPTDQELSEEFGLSRQTVRRAYLDLVNDGLVYRVPGRGTFVTPDHMRYHRPFQTVDDLFGLASDTEMVVVEGLAGTFNEGAASRLQIEGRLMYGLSFRRLHQGSPFCYTRVYLPPHIGRLLENDLSLIDSGSTGTGTVIAALVARGVRISGAEQSITAKAAGTEEVERLGAELGSPILHIERLYIDASGEPVELAVSEFLPEEYTHRMSLGRRLSL